MLTQETMTKIVKAILAGEGADPNMPEEELRFWQATASEIAALPPGAIIDLPSDWEV